MADGIGIKFDYKTDIPQFEVPAHQRVAESPKTPAQQPPSTNDNRVAWIKFPETKDVEQRGDEPVNLFRVMGANSQARDLARQWRRYQLRGTSFLDARKRTQLALFVSGLNGCDYSASWFVKRLRELGDSDLDCQRLAEGKPADSAAPVDSLVFKHAERLTREPWAAKESPHPGAAASRTRRPRDPSAHDAVQLSQLRKPCCSRLGGYARGTDCWEIVK